MSLNSEAPVCSICIANYNGMGVIDSCLESIFRQKTRLKVEVIIHDDASTDGSADWIAANYPQVSLLRSHENVGFCVANNRMVDMAKGDFLLLLNNDAELYPDALDVLFAASLDYQGDAILGLPQYDAATGELIDRGSFLDLFFNPVPNHRIGDREVAMIIGACLWISRGLWFKLGGFPVWLHTLSEDIYLCQLARLAGYPVRVLDSSGFRHWVGHSLGGGKVLGGRLSTTYRRRAASERNKASVLLVSAPISVLAVAFPLLLLSLCVEGLVISAIQRQWRPFKDVYWPVFSSLWIRRHTLWVDRQRVQHLKRIGTLEFLSVISLVPYKLKMLIRHGMPELR